MVRFDNKNLNLNYLSLFSFSPHVGNKVIDIEVVVVVIVVVVVVIVIIVVVVNVDRDIDGWLGKH